MTVLRVITNPPEPYGTVATRRAFAFWLPAAALLVAPLAAAAAANSAPKARQSIRLVYNPALLPLYARARSDIFSAPLAKQGVDVQWVDVQGSHAPAIAAVVGGSADVTFGGTTAVALTSAANGQDIVIAAMGRAIKTNGGIVVHAGSGINSVADLRGKTVAVNRGGFGELTLVTALQKNHIPRSEVNFLFLSLADGAVAFAAKQVDAYVALGSSVQTATTLYGGKMIFDVDKDMTPEESIIAGNTLSFVTTRKFAESHRDLLTKTFIAYRNVANWVNANEGAAFDLTMSANNYPTAIRDAYRSKFHGYAVDFPITDKDIVDLQKAADFLLANGVLPNPIDVRNYVAQY